MLVACAPVAEPAPPPQPVFGPSEATLEWRAQQAERARKAASEPPLAPGPETENPQRASERKRDARRAELEAKCAEQRAAPPVDGAEDFCGEMQLFMITSP